MLTGLFPACAIAQPLGDFLDQLLADGRIVAAQAVVAEHGDILLEHCVGTLSVESVREVDPETLFCIGSCSKAIAAGVIMRLVDEGKLNLDEPIDSYLPNFSALRVVGGEPAVRAPTLRELLCHRSGIYSQKRRITPAQTLLIRDFRQTLREAVDAIAKEPLFAQPGAEFGYSGAAYCVIGRVAEVAADEDYERVFQAQLAAPLRLKRSTYFPSPGDKNVAAGAMSQGQRLQTNPKTPHLYGADLRFPLIGGSLYSTARETTRYAQLIAGQGCIDSNRLLSEQAWNELVGQQAGQLYGLGWRLVLRNGRTIELSHDGALASSRSKMRIDLQTGRSAVVHYTVTDPDDKQIVEALDRVVRLAVECSADSN